MKKLSAFVLAIVLAAALSSLAGCGQGQSSPTSVQGKEDSMQSSQSGVRVSYIDVGKGDCILIQSDGAAGLIDTGYQETANKTVSYLQEQGVKKLDFLVVTHYDRDHVGGISVIGKAFGIDGVYLPDYEGADKNYRTVSTALDELKAPVTHVASEQALQLGGASIRLVPSPVEYVPDANGGEGNDNDLSLVAELTCQDDSYLFAGDLEKEGIASYLDEDPATFDVLKMPHHGKKSGGTDDLIDAVQPEIAIVTDSKSDPADKKTLKLLSSAGVDTYRTSTNGTIVVESNGTGNYSVTCAK